MSTQENSIFADIRAFFQKIDSEYGVQLREQAIANSIPAEAIRAYLGDEVLRTPAMFTRVNLKLFARSASEEDTALVERMVTFIESDPFLSSAPYLDALGKFYAERYTETEPQRTISFRPVWEGSVPNLRPQARLNVIDVSGDLVVDEQLSIGDVLHQAEAMVRGVTTQLENGMALFNGGMAKFGANDQQGISTVLPLLRENLSKLEQVSSNIPKELIETAASGGQPAGAEIVDQ